VLTRRGVLAAGMGGTAALLLGACRGGSADDGRAAPGPTAPGPTAGGPATSAGPSDTVRSGLPARQVVPYGQHRLQTAELLRPDSAPPWPAVILIHGGFWRRGYSRELEAYVATDLVSRGYVVWNLEYRSSGARGGGWPGTFDDVAHGIDTLRGMRGVDLERVVAVGHSAGGQLAVWAAARPGLPAGAPGVQPRVRLAAAVSQAGVVDLISAADDHLGADAAVALLGGRPGEVPDRYASASPAERTPIGVPLLLVHGLDDDVVPVEQSRTLAERAEAAGDTVDLVEVPHTGHFEHLDPTTPAWTPVVDFLDRVIPA
jgi:acetyl esterase/lipase